METWDISWEAKQNSCECPIHSIHPSVVLVIRHSNDMGGEANFSSFHFIHPPTKDEEKKMKKKEGKHKFSFPWHLLSFHSPRKVSPTHSLAPDDDDDKRNYSRQRNFLPFFNYNRRDKDLYSLFRLSLVLSLSQSQSQTYKWLINTAEAACARSSWWHSPADRTVHSLTPSVKSTRERPLSLNWLDEPLFYHI